MTIHKFIVIQKIEKVKELLFYDEMTATAIAHQLNYNSVAYLSGVFKKETGITLSKFKELRDPNRRGISE
jgi:AraC-like DNA-binding protein